MSISSYLSNLNTLSLVAATIQMEMSSDNEPFEDIFATSSQDIKNLSSPISSPLENEESFINNNSRMINSEENLKLVNSLLCLKHRNYTYGSVLDCKKAPVPRWMNKNKCIQAAKLLNKKCAVKHGKPHCLIKRRQGQGRPYTNSLKARFYVQESIDELYCYLNSILSFTFREPSSSKPKTYRSTRTSPKQPHFKMLCFNNLPSTTDLFDKLCEAFKIANFKFVKINKNIEGKVDSIETIRKTDSVITAEWIKQNVCRPRYKSNMKIYLIRSDHLMRETIYKDKSLFECDIENVYNTMVKIVD